jgi:hypothetical protein
MIYVGRTYTATVSAQTLKSACCENCNGTYFYQMQCTAQGQGSSPYYLDNDGAQRRSQAAAQKNLQKLLNGILPIRCPDCGFYQQDMVRILRGTSGTRWLLYIGIFPLLIGLLMLLCENYEAGGYTFVAGATLVSLWWALRSTFDPNTVAFNSVKFEHGVYTREKFLSMIAEWEEAPREAMMLLVAKADQEAAAKPSGTPKTQTEQQLNEAARSQRRKFRVLSALGTGLACSLCITPFANRQAEKLAYEQAFRAGQPQVVGIEKYLARFPQGSHAAELRTTLDDVVFNNAKRTFQRIQQPAELLRYVVRPAAMHVDEARALLTSMRETVANSLTSHRNEKNAAFVDLMLAALKKSSDLEQPFLVLRITTTAQLAPATAEEQDREDDALKSYAESFPEVKFQLDPKKKRAAIIDPSPAFSKQATTLRHRNFATMLQHVMTQLSDSSYFQIKLSENIVEVVDIAVENKVEPTGALNVWSREMRNGSRTVSSSTAGLLRLFKSHWTITLRNAQPATFDTEAHPNVQYSADSRQPPWKIYNALQQSAMYELAPPFYESLGLQAPATQKVFSSN